MADPDAPLVLTFDPQTVDHLGAKMYSHLPNAVAELIANAYDADATQVAVRLLPDNSLLIEDDGHGMSRNDVADKYLHIGRNRRVATESQLTEGGGRSVSGKKGLGKLALFGIGKSVELSTTRAGSLDKTVVRLSYEDMMAASGEYLPEEETTTSASPEHGTSVLLSDLKRTTPIDPRDLARSLSKLFNYAGSDFRITIVGLDGTEQHVNPALRLDATDVEFEWTFPESWLSDEDEFGREHAISGRIISSKSPLRQGLRGITLYVNGRLANEPEFFGSSESSFAYSYLTGYLEVDFLDRLDSDVIATDRRAIDWGTSETSALQDQLRVLMVRIGQEWRSRRAAARRSQRTEALDTDTDSWVESIRTPEKEPVRNLIAAIESENIDITVDQQNDLLKLVKTVAPPHAEYVWRHLHPELQSATRSYYIAQDYWAAVQEAIKRYVTESKRKSGVDASEATGIVQNAFGENGRLRVFKAYMLNPGFDPQTERNIENGQKHISMGVVAGFRNPLAHEEIARLQESGAFTSDDCLDALSILSHLMRRLDNAIDVVSPVPS